MQFIRSVLFTILFYLTLILVFVLAIPTLILPSKAALICGKILAYIIIFLLRFILGVKVTFSGIENLKKNERFFVASAHQSLLETFILQAPLQYPVFILKKELLKIPLFGWYLKKIGSIVVDRNKYTKDNLGFLKNIQENYEKNLGPVVIFPQGTRVSNSYREPFKKGVFRIYDSLKIKCQPVAINSGSVWPKKGTLGKNKTLYISILKPIEPGLDNKKFMADLQNSIYSELNKLN